jgi:hypothetical protein
MGEKTVVRVVVEDLNLVFPETPGGAEVEVVGVFVAKLTMFNLCPLTPVGSTFSIQVAEAKFCCLTKAALKRRKMARFLEAIKEKNDSPAVGKVNRRELSVPSPSSSSRADALKPKAKTSHGRTGKMGVIDTIPVRGDNGGKI